jgi:transcriptional regulator with XRE-family HTH domain
MMRMKPNQAIRELRKITNQTQGEFAAMIGVSKDAVASWEIGRSNLSRSYARRIAFATGADEAALLRRRSPLTVPGPLGGRQPFTGETFAQHRKSNWGRSDEAAVRHHLKHCVDALRLLFLAAATPAGSRRRQQLPALLESFSQWCEQAREDFHLEKHIETQLQQRKFKIGQTQPYGRWRQWQREAPAVFKAVGFKDDPSKGDNEKLFIGREAVPDWTPGACMKGPIPGRTRLLPRH